MLRSFILIGAGGAIGSMMRYGVTLLCSMWSHTSFPLATFSINLLGCLAIGLIYGLADRQGWLQSNLWFFLATGICGGFTTFSAFALESNLLIQKQLSFTALLYAASSVIIGLLLCKIGMLLGSS